MIPNNGRKESLKVYSLLTIGAVLFVGGLLLAQFIISQEKKLDNTFYPNVFIDNMPVEYKTKEQVNRIFSEKNKKFAGVKVEVVYKDQPIATLSAQQINLHSNGAEIADRAYLVGRSTHSSSRVLEKLTSIFYLRRYNFFSGVTYDKGVLKDIVADFEDQYNRPAKNALFTFADGRVSTFRPDEKGIALKTDIFYTDFDKKITLLDKQPKNLRVPISDVVIEPEITLSKANNFGIEDLIGEGISNYTGSIPGRVHNVILGAQKMHGVLIPKDQIFSFNDTIGDISAQTGYEQAYIIQNGRTVLGDGGGVCQISTTLFRAALNTGLPIVERTAHAYRVHYYENDNKPGLDATVFAPSVDFKFKNDTSAAILIQTEIDQDNNILTFKFYGKKDTRKVTLSPITVYDQVPPGPDKLEDDPTLPRGQTRQVDWSAWGAKSVFTYKVEKDNQITFEKQFLSVYRPWQAVFLVGTKDS